MSAEREAGDALPLVAIYADESCLGNGREGDNPGGAAGVIEHVNAATERLTRWDYWIAEPSTTNNRMALRSAIEAFRVIGRKGGRFRVLFTSDSQYLVKGMTEWVYGWAAAGGDARKGAIENLALWQELVDGRVAASRAVAVGARPRRSSAERVRERPRRAGGEGAVVVRGRAHVASSTNGSRHNELRKRVMVEPAPFPSGRPFAPTRPLPWASTTSH